MKQKTYFPVVTQYEMNLPFYITTIGYGREARNQRENGLGEAQLLYTAGGTGRCRMNGREFVLAKRSLFYLPPFTPHDYWPEGEWITYWVTFNGYASGQMLSSEAGVGICPDSLDFEARIKQIMHHRKTAQWSEKSSVLLYELLIDCGEIFRETGGNRNRLKTKLAPVFAYIQEHYHENIELEELADACGKSREHFCKIFREFTGMRPFEYITDMRIQAAKNLLLYRPDLKIEEIGKLVGYTSNSYFSKMFKSIENVTPAQFRNYRR